MIADQDIIDYLSEQEDAQDILTIAKALNIHRNTASRHLQNLIASGSVTQKRRGKFIFYEIVHQIPYQDIINELHIPAIITDGKHVNSSNSAYQQLYPELREHELPSELQNKLPKHVTHITKLSLADTEITLFPLTQSKTQYALSIQDAGNSHLLNLYKHALQTQHEALLITDAQLESPGPHIVDVNEAFCEMSGYERDELLGQTPRMLQGPKTDRKVLQALKRSLYQGEKFSATTTNYRKDGTEYIVEWQIVPVRDIQGTITHYVSVQRNQTKQAQDQQLLLKYELYHQAIHSVVQDHTSVEAALNLLASAFDAELEIGGKLNYATKKMEGHNGVCIKYNDLTLTIYPYNEDGSSKILRQYATNYLQLLDKLHMT